MEPREGKMAGTPGSEVISTRLERIATLARQLRDQPLTTLGVGERVRSRKSERAG
jgi:hypothetical protein